MIPEAADPVFAECVKTFPERPTIDVAETPYTRDELAARIDRCMGQLHALTIWSHERDQL